MLLASFLTHPQAGPWLLPTFRTRPCVPGVLLFPSWCWTGVPGQQPSQQHSLLSADEEQQQQDGEVVNWEGAGAKVKARPVPPAPRWLNRLEEPVVLPGRVRGRCLLSSGLQEEELGRPCTRVEWKTR